MMPVKINITAIAWFGTKDEAELYDMDCWASKSNPYKREEQWYHFEEMVDLDVDGLKALLRMVFALKGGGREGRT